MIERVLIVGLGSIGKRHLRIARETLPDADIRVLRHNPCNTTPEFADGCFDELVEACSFAPQVAVIANPAPFHLESALGLANAGSHLLVEKPLSHATSGIPSFLQRLRGKNLVLQVGYNLRFSRSLERFRARIRADAIGRVLSIRCQIGQYLPSWRPEADYRSSVSARRELGGGVLLELSHELDYLRWIFGEVNWVNAWLGRQSSLHINVEDSAHLILGFAPDASGRAPVAALSLDFFRRDSTRLCTAIGERGSLRWNGLEGTIEEQMSESNKWRSVFSEVHEKDDSYRSQWRGFLACVQTNETPRVTGEDGLAVLGIVEAARASAAADGTRFIICQANSLTQI